MGYTHYWNQSRAFSDAEWKAMETMTRKIFRVAQEDLGIGLAEDYDLNHIPIVDERRIRFNGYREEGHETFVVMRYENGRSFCKTARKPYDAAVVAILIQATLTNDGFSWSSDGDGEDELMQGADEILNRISIEDYEEQRHGT